MQAQEWLQDKRQHTDPGRDVVPLAREAAGAVAIAAGLPPFAAVMTCSSSFFFSRSSILAVTLSKAASEPACAHRWLSHVHHSVQAS